MKRFAIALAGLLILAPIASQACDRTTRSYSETNSNKALADRFADEDCRREVASSQTCGFDGCIQEARGFTCTYTIYQCSFVMPFAEAMPDSSSLTSGTCYDLRNCNGRSVHVTERFRCPATFDSFKPDIGGGCESLH